MHNLIIVNHIGTSVLETVKTEMLTLVEEIEAIKPEAKVLLAFSSDRARRKLGSKGMDVISMQRALEDGVEGGYKDITIMPLHVVGGRDYKNLAAVVDILDCGIRLLKPLLFDEKTTRITAEAIRWSLTEEDRVKQILAIGHGTDDESQRHYQALETAMSDLGLAVKVLTLEDDRSLMDGLSEEVVLYPLFTVSGYHLKKDVFEGDKSIRQYLEKTGHRVKAYQSGLLAMPTIRRIYLDRL